MLWQKKPTTFFKIERLHVIENYQIFLTNMSISIRFGNQSMLNKTKPISNIYLQASTLIKAS